eukprot:TRINITY_DN4611_c0_g1_i1.p1 TRINITY_DN4611_c0_g1~~TRINITY_DN4611_c0_g1_i1.p1  ORF type:complete len:352 (+),score=66.63 TRINITY_DN4611_c0_g1_i1:94-1149(+)
MNKEKCIQYLKRNLGALPEAFASQESNKLTFIFFNVSSLDLLGALDTINKEQVIQYIYSLQVLPYTSPEVKVTGGEPLNAASCGFRGSHFVGDKYPTTNALECDHMYLYDHGHLAMTYTALATLRILGDDYSRVNKKAISRALALLQKSNGSFTPVAADTESDIRFIYCAATISYMIGELDEHGSRCAWNIEKAAEYILASQSYDAALGQGPGNEGHGGSTFCGLAALSLTNQLHKLKRKDQLVRWIVERQHSGFQGRVNKDPDSCYSFWLGGSLDILGFTGLLDTELLKAFVVSCQHKIGGFSKYPDHHPDPLHTYLSLCGLSLIGDENVLPLDSRLNISKRAATSAPFS